MTASELRDSITAYLDQGGDAKTLLAQLNGSSRTFALGVIDMRENPTADEFDLLQRRHNKKQRLVKWWGMDRDEYYEIVKQPNDPEWEQLEQWGPDEDGDGYEYV